MCNIFNTVCRTPNIYFLTPNICLLGKSVFESGLLFSRDIPLLLNLRFPCFSTKPYYQNVRIDPDIFLGVR